MILCDYGCEQIANYKFKNGKNCCSKNHKQCPNAKKSKHNCLLDNTNKLVSCQFCDKTLFYARIKQHEKSCHLNPDKIKRCLNCNNIIKTGNKFCSRSCSNSYSNKNRKLSSKTKDKISLSRRGKYLGQYTYEIICPVCKNITYHRTYEKDKFTIEKACSKECHKRLLSKKLKGKSGGYRKRSGYGKYGYYKGIFCNSSYELIFLAYHINIGSNIKRCKLKIPYVYNKEPHFYHPDFDIDGIIYEIKGYWKNKVGSKLKAARECGYNIKILYKKDIEHMEKYLKNKYGFSNILDLYDK